MTTDEDLARVIMNVARQENIHDLDILRKQVPKRFWVKVVDELGNFTNSFNEPWTPKTLAMQWKRKKDILVSIMTNLHNLVNESSSYSRSAQTGTQEPDAAGTSEDKDKEAAKPARPAGWNPEWEEYLKEFAQDEIRGAEDHLFNRVMERIEKSLEDKISVRHLNPDPDIPPAPPREKRKMTGIRGHISARVDKELLELFRRDRDEKFEGNSSRCLNWILWTFYGKPPLSFQRAEDL